MIDVTLHAPPRWRDVVLEQIRIVGLRLRREALVVAIVFGLVTLLTAIAIVRGNAESWFDTDEWALLGFASFFLPFAVWRGETRFGPALLWTFPVDRRRLALAKVFAGWVWLMIGLALAVGSQTILAAVSGVAGAETISLFAFSGTTATYLFGSALVLGLRHPLRWLLGIISVCFVLHMFASTVGGPGVVETLLVSSGFSSALRTAGTASRAQPHLAAAVITAVSFALGLAALWAAASRHREGARHRKRPPR